MCDTTPNKKRKKCFVEAWLSDERFKSWIQKVSSDDSLFHCIVCDKNYSCSSCVQRHAESAGHKRNMGESTSLDNDNDVSSNKKPRKQFRQAWLDIEQFKPWLREVQDDANKFSCMICNKVLIGGLTEITRHAESETHKNNFEKYDVQTSESNKELNMQTDESFLLFEEQKKLAEIRYAALIANHNISHQTAKIILNFFQDVGNNSNVLKNMKMGETKCTNIITNVLCPIETNRVVQNIQNTKFSIFIDETSDITNEKWMTFYVRYVHPETLKAHSQLVKLINIDATDCSAEKLFTAFKKEMWTLKIPFSNIIALSCDNASVMVGKHLSFKKKLEEMCKNVLTFSCPCHSAALVAHAACAKIPQACEEFVKKVINYVNSSPKRMAIFRDFSEFYEERNYKLLKLSDTRWLSRHKSIERILEFWDTIKSFLYEMLINEKTKSGENLMCIMQNVDTKAYLLFLKYTLNYFNMFNAFFQAEETRIHLLQPKSLKLLEVICNNFLKSEVLKSSVFPNILFDEIENHKSLSDVNLGSECEEYLCQLMKDGYTNIVANVRENCLQFYVTAAKEIFKRLPVNNLFLSNLKVFHPNIVLSNTDKEVFNLLFKHVSFVAKTIGGFDEINLKKEWCALHSEFTITEKQNLSKLEFDDMWIQIFQRDSSNIKFSNLRSLVNSIRAFPNSNADSERVFSMLTDIKTKKRNCLSSKVVNAICVLKSALKARGENALNIKIDTEHLSYMSSDKLYLRKGKCSQLYATDEVAGPSSSIV